MSSVRHLAEPARLDAERSARPKTRIIAHVSTEGCRCVGPRTEPEDLHLEDVATGQRTPVRGRRQRPGK